MVKLRLLFDMITSLCQAVCCCYHTFKAEILGHNSGGMDYHSPIPRKVRLGHVESCELTCVLNLRDFLDRVFESLLFSYGDGKSVIQKLQKIVDCFMYTYITYKGYTRCLRCFLGLGIYKKLKQGLEFETFGSGSHYFYGKTGHNLPV